MFLCRQRPFPSAEFSLPVQITPLDVTCVLLNQIQLWQHSEHTELRSTFSGALLLLLISLLLLSCLAFPFTEVYRSWFLTVILVSMWTAGMFTVFEVWCWAAAACGLDKMDHGRRRFWVLSEKMSGYAPYVSLSHFSLSCFGLCCCSICKSLCHKSFTSVSLSSSLHLCPSCFPLKTPISKMSVWSAALVSITEKVNLVWSKGFDSLTVHCCTLNLCQN